MRRHHHRAWLTSAGEQAFGGGRAPAGDSFGTGRQQRRTPLRRGCAGGGSPNHEDGGNADATDDLDYAGLRDYLEGKFRDTKAIRYEIRYRRVGKGRGNEVYVDYTYSASYKLGTEQGEIWRRTVADNRLELVPHGDSYRIVAGM